MVAAWTASAAFALFLCKLCACTRVRAHRECTCLLRLPEVPAKIADWQCTHVKAPNGKKSILLTRFEGESLAVLTICNFCTVAPYLSLSPLSFLVFLGGGGRTTYTGFLFAAAGFVLQIELLEQPDGNVTSSRATKSRCHLARTIYSKAHLFPICSFVKQAH